MISRTGTLTYEVARGLTAAGLGQSIAVSIGADAIVGSTFGDWLQWLEADTQTQAIVLVGQVGGEAEELAAQAIAAHVTKPVVAYIAGQMAPQYRRLGHANAILAAQVDVGAGTLASKVKALKRAGVRVANNPSQLPQLLRSGMGAIALPETA
jgi:succinyl-CoA synthetase alpha subunit